MFMSVQEKLEHIKITTQTVAGIGILSTQAMVNIERLYRNRDFKLIHVHQDDDGERQSMRIVTPALDRHIRWQVREERYYAVSHTWGPDEEQLPWTDHGIIGTDGQPVEVKMRPEKKETFLRLLSKNPGFWWIDVFCAQSKTPPVIMGDVYRFCLECFALIDYPSAGFARIEAINSSLPSIFSREFAESHERCVEYYKRHINGKMGSENQSWHDSFDDIFDEWYDGDPADIKALADFYGCQWFTRVWTLQEYLLPGCLTFVSEDDPVYATLARQTVGDITYEICSITSEALQSYIPSVASEDDNDVYLSLSAEQYEYASTTPGVSRCYFDLARLDAFQLRHRFNSGCGCDPGSNTMALRHVSSKLDLLGPVLVNLARLPRECKYTRDYIFGVAGLLDLDIPKTDNDEEVWASFRKIVQKRAPYFNVPETSPLSGATNMQDVYKPFLGVNVRANSATMMEYMKRAW